jgi:hypothetical protein
MPNRNSGFPQGVQCKATEIHHAAAYLQIRPAAKR